MNSENNIKYYFDKQITLQLKGILLICMFILHFFCFPSWYVEGVSYPKLEWMSNFQGHFQICIAGFAFLTGYFYTYVKEKNFKYSFKKIFEIFLPYWTVLLLFLILALMTNTYTFHIGGFILEFLSLKQELIFFGWYVTFYVISILVLPLLIRITKNSILLFAGIALFIPIFVYYGVSHFISLNLVISILEKFQVYFPIMAIGYITSKESIFFKAEKLFQRIKSYLKIMIYILLIFIVFMEPSWLYGLPENFIFAVVKKCVRIVSIPVFMYAFINIFKLIKKQWLKPLEIIGKYSMLMWFHHSLFFNCSKEIFQKFLYFPKNPILVLLWGLAINLFAAWLLNYIVVFINRRIKKL